MKRRIRNGGEELSDSSMLMSFAKEFNKNGKSRMEDIINGVFVAENLFKMRFQVRFKGIGNLGVDSSEIRSILLYDKSEKEANHKKASRAAKHLAGISSNELGWLAQYLFNGKKHLYKKEADAALKTRKTLLEIQV